MSPAQDARHPLKYRMLVGMVDCVFADVAQPDQARIVSLNSHLFLKNEGHTVISVKANCIDSTAPAEHVFAQEVTKLKGEQFKPLEQLTLEPGDLLVLTGKSRWQMIHRVAGEGNGGARASLVFGCS